MQGTLRVCELREWEQRPEAYEIALENQRLSGESSQGNGGRRGLISAALL